PSRSSPWLAESATECTLSASIDPEPVSRKPTNFATAMPALVSNAATTALVPCAPPATGVKVAVGRAGSGEPPARPALWVTCDHAVWNSLFPGDDCGKSGERPGDCEIALDLGFCRSQDHHIHHGSTSRRHERRALGPEQRSEQEAVWGEGRQPT